MAEIINLNSGENVQSEFKTVEETLELALKMIRENDSVLSNCSKVLILALDDRNSAYDVGFVQSGMKASECISLCEVAKTNFLEVML